MDDGTLSPYRVTVLRAERSSGIIWATTADEAEQMGVTDVEEHAGQAPGRIRYDGTEPDEVTAEPAATP